MMTTIGVLLGSLRRDLIVSVNQLMTLLRITSERALITFMRINANTPAKAFFSACPKACYRTACTQWRTSLRRL